MKYYRRRWNEDRGDEHSDWGCSWWYFEVSEAGEVVRQMEAYDSGVVRRFSLLAPQDDDGPALEFDLADMSPYEIGRAEFETRWGSR